MHTQAPGNGVCVSTSCWPLARGGGGGGAPSPLRRGTSLCGSVWFCALRELRDFPAAETGLMGPGRCGGWRRGGQGPAPPAGHTEVPRPGLLPLIPWMLMERNQVPDASVLGRQLCKAAKFLGLMCPSGGGRPRTTGEPRSWGTRTMILKQIKQGSGREWPGGQGGLRRECPERGWRPGRAGQALCGRSRKWLACPARAELGFSQLGMRALWGL